MGSLVEFERGLREIISFPTKARPFVCSGSPLDTQIFLVGFNPATHLDAEFWKFWKSEQGFDKVVWQEVYVQERASKPLKPGKKFRPRISPTRANIEAFVEGARPLSVLETNIFAIASDTKPELAMEDRDSRSFRYLVETIKPRVIVTHGVDAKLAVATIETTAQIRNIDHLSRGWKRSDVFELGRSAAALALASA